MPPPEKLKGLSRRPRKLPPKPEPPEGYMWVGFQLERVSAVYGRCYLMLRWYDNLEPKWRQYVQEQGVHALRKFYGGV